MKKITIFLLLAFFGLSFCAYAQVPQSINYQAVLRNATGQIIQNQSAIMEFIIHSANPTGAIVYEETHTTATNDYGLINLQIGQGIPVVGTFSAIQWGTNSYFLEVGANIGGGYVNLGTTQFISVPYAMVADTALHSVDNQTLSINGDTLSISNGNSVTLSSPIPNIVVFTSSGTWIKPIGLKYIIVEVQAGGGAGGNTTNVGHGAGGGGSGGYSKKLLEASLLDSSVQITVGAGGIVGGSGAGGGNGNNSSFGVLVITTGGNGGSAGSSSSAGGAGGTASFGDINIPGIAGGHGAYLYIQTSIGGAGGSSFLGNGAGNNSKGQWASPGTNGGLYGAGGSGASAGDSSNDISGGAGAAGVVIVTEYY